MASRGYPWCQFADPWSGPCRGCAAGTAGCRCRRWTSLWLRGRWTSPAPCGGASCRRDRTSPGHLQAFSERHDNCKSVAMLMGAVSWFADGVLFRRTETCSELLCCESLCHPGLLCPDPDRCVLKCCSVPRSCVLTHRAWSACILGRRVQDRCVEVLFSGGLCPDPESSSPEMLFFGCSVNAI